MRDFSKDERIIAEVFDRYEVEDREHPLYRDSIDGANYDEYDSDEFDLELEFEDESEPPESAYDDGIEDDSFQNHPKEAKRSKSPRERGVERPNRAGNVNSAKRGSKRSQSERERFSENRGSDGVRKRPDRLRGRAKDGEEDRRRVDSREEGAENQRRRKRKVRRHVDKRTGVEYEVLPGSNPEMVKDYKKTGSPISMEEMMRNTKKARGFDGIDLAKSAARFLPHMQVPISKKEREEARRALSRSQEDDFDDEYGYDDEDSYGYDDEDDYDYGYEDR